MSKEQCIILYNQNKDYHDYIDRVTKNSDILYNDKDIFDHLIIQDMADYYAKNSLT